MASKVMSEPLHDESETRLIRAATAGDPEAFGRLVLMYQDRLVNSLFHLLGNQAEAEDVAQEAFVLAFLKLAAGLWRRGDCQRLFAGCGLTVHRFQCLRSEQGLARYRDEGLGRRGSSPRNSGLFRSPRRSRHANVGWIVPRLSG